MVESGQRAQTPIYKMNKFLGCNVQEHSDCISLKVAKSKS